MLNVQSKKSSIQSPQSLDWREQKTRKSVFKILLEGHKILHHGGETEKGQLVEAQVPALSLPQMQN